MNETDVQTLLHEHADALSPAALDPDLLISKGRARKQHRRIAVVAGLSTLVVGAVVSVLLTTGGSEHPSMITVRPPTPSPSVVVTPTPSPTPTAAKTPVVQPAVKFPARWSAAASGPPLTAYPDAPVVVGNRTIYWGGEKGQDAKDGYTSAGAVLDVTTRRWSNMAPSPLAGRIFAGAAGSNQLAFIWGGSGATAFADGATYDPVANAWHKASPSPLSPRVPLGITWTGTEFVVVGGGIDSAAYNPTTNTWRKLPNLPAAFPKGKVAQVAGHTVILVGGALPAAGGKTVAYSLSVEGTTWERMPDPPAFTDDQLALATDGTTLVAAGTANPFLVAEYSFATGVWRATNTPLPLATCNIELAVTQTEIIAGICSNVAVQSRATGVWDLYPEGSFGDFGPQAPLVVGGETVVWNVGTLFYQ
jgi:hypothetical protein